jgi:hypothetical protein
VRAHPREHRHRVGGPTRGLDLTPVRSRGERRDAVDGSVLMLGIGNLAFPILLTMVLFGAVLVVVMNIVVDCLQALLDPRIRLS